MQRVPKDFTPLDPGRVNSMDPIEMAYWRKQLGCTAAELQDAVAKVGEHITAIREWLTARRPTDAVARS